jgi:hypothetical protein
MPGSGTPSALVHIYRCQVLAATILPRQCDANRATARQQQSTYLRAIDPVQACLGCPGVIARSGGVPCGTVRVAVAAPAQAAKPRPTQIAAIATSLGDQVRARAAQRRSYMIASTQARAERTRSDSEARRALAHERYHEMARLRREEGLTHAEIAARCGCSAATVHLALAAVAPDLLGPHRRRARR